MVLYAISSKMYGSEPDYLSPIGLNIYLGHSKPDNWDLKVAGVRNNIIGHREDAKIVAEANRNQTLSNAEVSRFWLSKTIDYITENPGLYIRTQSQKLALLFSPSSYIKQESYHYWRKKEAPLKYAFFNFSIIFSLFIGGLILLQKDEKATSRASKFTVLAGTIYLFSMMATIVIERYRVTAFVFMIPVASYMLQQLMTDISRHFRLLTIIFLFLVGSIATGQFIKPRINEAQYSNLESKEIHFRQQQENWFNLRSKLDDEHLSAQTCYEMQNELTNLGYHRDLKALAIACASY